MVDPQRDIDRVEDLLAQTSLALTLVVETPPPQRLRHRWPRAGRKTGATYLVNDADEVVLRAHSGPRRPETVEVGERMRVTAVATPGHTFTHLSYVLSDASTGEQVAVFSGGSLLFGATGRPDLLGEEHTDELVRLQHPRPTAWPRRCRTPPRSSPPTGSARSARPPSPRPRPRPSGRRSRSNPVLTQDEETYVRELLDGLGA